MTASKSDRRLFLQQSAVTGLALSGAGPLLACKSEPPKAEAPAEPAPAPEARPEPEAPPSARPEGWDPVAYNLERGAAGAIPAAYMQQIRAEGGLDKHLGKHLPYVPADLPEARRVEGYLPLMWGDPEKGHARHPNAMPTEGNPDGHWYDWIRVAIAGQPGSEVETRFDRWPVTTPAVNGKLTGLESTDPTADDGRNTVYLAELPKGAKPGDTLRVWAHCLTHGEYVDFVELPAAQGSR